MKRLLILSLISVSLLLTSCVSEKKMQKTIFRPNVVRLDMTMQDFEYVGDLTVTVDYTQYGANKRITAVNGEKYDPRYIKQFAMRTNYQFPNSKTIKKALYKISETYPDAAYYIPTSYNVDKRKMFTGGAYVTESLRVQVYKLK